MPKLCVISLNEKAEAVFKRAKSGEVWLHSYPISGRMFFSVVEDIDGRFVASQEKSVRRKCVENWFW